jgi:hypothetical protein
MYYMYVYIYMHIYVVYIFIYIPTPLTLKTPSIHREYVVKCSSPVGRERRYRSDHEEGTAENGAQEQKATGESPV